MVSFGFSDILQLVEQRFGKPAGTALLAAIYATVMIICLTFLLHTLFSILVYTNTFSAKNPEVHSLLTASYTFGGFAEWVFVVITARMAYRARNAVQEVNIALDKRKEGLDKRREILNDATAVLKESIASIRGVRDKLAALGIDLPAIDLGALEHLDTLGEHEE